MITIDIVKEIMENKYPKLKDMNIFYRVEKFDKSIKITFNINNKFTSAFIIDFQPLTSIIVNDMHNYLEFTIDWNLQRLWIDYLKEINK